MRKKIWIVARATRASAYGIGTYQANLIACLKKSGVDFGVIELNSSLKEVSIEQKSGYEQISIPSIHAGTQKHGQYYSRNVAYLLRELIPEDYECYPIFHLNLMNDSVLVRYIKKLFKCKIILTVHYTNWSFSLLGDVRRLDGIMSKKKKLLDSFEKGIRAGFEEDIKMAQRCDSAIYIAEHSAKAFSKYVKTKNQVVINNGLKDRYKKPIRGGKDSVRTKYMIPPRAEVILFAGRLDEVKGVRYLIEAFRKVLSDHPDALLVIAGDGEFAPLFREAENIWSKIVFTGKLDKGKLYDLYQSADIGVVSSIHEEFGYVAVEMMMHGLPVIAGDTGGLAEIIEKGVSGLKVPIVTRKGQRRLDSKTLASKINLLLEDLDFAAKLGEGGRKRFLERYELSVFGEKMISLYNSL